MNPEQLNADFTQIIIWWTLTLQFYSAGNDQDRTAKTNFKGNFLDLIADKVSLADAFASVEPENNFHSNQGVEPSLANC